MIDEKQRGTPTGEVPSDGIKRERFVTSGDPHKALEMVVEIKPRTVASLADRLKTAHENASKKAGASAEEISQRESELFYERKILEMVTDKIAHQKVREAEERGESINYYDVARDIQANDAADALGREYLDTWEDIAQRDPSAKTDAYNHYLYPVDKAAIEGGYAGEIRKLQTEVLYLAKAGRNLHSKLIATASEQHA